MKLYYAKHHVRVGRQIARPGEVFEAEMPEEELERLLQIGAIAKCEIDPEQEAELMQEAGEESESEPAEDSPEAPADTTEDAEVSADIADIDVMDGISAPGKKKSRKGGKAK